MGLRKVAFRYFKLKINCFRNIGWIGQPKGGLKLYKKKLK